METNIVKYNENLSTEPGLNWNV